MIDQVKHRRKKPKDFLTLYQESCGRYGTCPIKFSRAYLLDGILDVNVDRFRKEDWKPFLEALQENESLRTIAVRSFSKSCFYGIRLGNTKLPRATVVPLTNSDMLPNLCASLAQVLRTSPVLESLTIQNLPLKLDHLQILKESIPGSNNLMYLSLEKCQIGDAGVKEICIALKNVPSLKAINLSECNLTWQGVTDICGVLQYHGLMLQSDAWCASLRQKSTQAGQENGLRILSLDGNPGIGDRGTIKLTEALMDDLWLKELGLQHCGITDEGAHALLKLLTQNPTLSVVDIQGNPVQDQTVFEKLSKTREKAVRIQMNNKQMLTPHFCWQARGQISSRNAKETKAEAINQATKAPNDEMYHESLSEIEIQLSLYKRLLEEETAAHKETMKKLKKLTTENEALQAILRNASPGSFVDNAVLAQIEDTFLKLQEFLRVVKASGLEHLIGTPTLDQGEKEFTNKPDPSTTAETVPVSSVVANHRMQTTAPQTAVNSRRVQWTALQRHQAAGQPVTSPSPDLVSQIVYDNRNWLKDEGVEDGAESVMDQSNIGGAIKLTTMQTQDTLVQHVEDFLESQGNSWGSKTMQLESRLVYSSKRASGSGASDTSNSRHQHNTNERSSSVSLTDIVSEDEF